jgi:ppGpp synthetase/RelA/SpoT-type nucleotidyltranferase
VVVEYDGKSIEVQLRTQAMHQWAVTVERLSGSLNQDLRSGSEASELMEWLGEMSETTALEEAGHVLSQATVDRLNMLRIRAVKYIAGEMG